MELLERYRRLPAALRHNLLNPLLRRFWPSPKMDKYLYLSTLPLEQRYLNAHLYDRRLREVIYHEDFRGSLNGFDPLESLQPTYRQSASWDLLSRLLYLDTKTWLPNDLLIKADRMSMAASIELRVPFLDHRLVEYAATIPSRYKVRGRQTKYILKRALETLLPREILHRKKMGFPTPLAWMFKCDLGSYIEEVLLDPQTEQRGYFDPLFTRRLVQEHRSGDADHHSVLWRLLILEEWHRQFADTPVPTAMPVKAAAAG
jgi:asparagine synthase (glutamine-hydrolysing)